ncbi:MAG TPA: hypothetical protein VF329_01825 [Gammaproteobacteria bacterium]
MHSAKRISMIAETDAAAAVARADRDTIDRARGDAAVLVLAVVGLVWLGALLGVSFLATPVKFLAPSLTLPVALDVGRQTFSWFGRIEVVLALAGFASAAAFGLPALRSAFARRGTPHASAGLFTPGALALVTAAALLAAVAVQNLWLLPTLDARVEVILQGGTPPPSSLHRIYIAMDTLKLAGLAVVSWIALAALRRGRAS